MKRFIDAALLLMLLSVALAPPVLGQDATPAGPIYIVQSGDTLFKIAFEHNSTVEAFTELNNINNPALIFVGQQLRIPVDESLALPPVLPDFIPPHASLPAQGLPWCTTWLRQTRYPKLLPNTDSPWSALVDRNQITDASLLHVGQQIYIPGLEPQVIDAPWPEPVSLLQLGPGELLQGQSVRFVVQTTLPAQVRGGFLGSDLHFVADESQRNHMALTGIPLYTVPGFHDLGVTVDAGAVQTAFQWPLEGKGRRIWPPGCDAAARGPGHFGQGYRECRNRPIATHCFRQQTWALVRRPAASSLNRTSNLELWNVKELQSGPLRQDAQRRGLCRCHRNAGTGGGGWVGGAGKRAERAWPLH